jgi:predicted enzyme related to lactoylglutathione lyase
VASEATALPGQIGWIDLTVPDAGSLREFHSGVTEWSPAPVSMGDYRDYCVNTADGQSVRKNCARARQTGEAFFSTVAGIGLVSVAPAASPGRRNVFSRPQGVAGMGHARGGNAGLPPVWIVDSVAADLDVARQHCEARGGKVLGTPGNAGGGNRFSAIQDPPGAIAALCESRSQAE